MAHNVGSGYNPNDFERAEYDTAQICLSGHVITTSYNAYPQYRQNFCQECGNKTITQCPECHKPIRGHLQGSMSVGDEKAPAYCCDCGSEYPWTHDAIEAAAHLLATEQFGEFVHDEHEADLRRDITSAIQGGPKSISAATKLAKIIANAGPAIRNGVRDILINLVSDAIAQRLW